SRGVNDPVFTLTTTPSKIRGGPLPRRVHHPLGEQPSIGWSRHSNKTLTRTSVGSPGGNDRLTNPPRPPSASLYNIAGEVLVGRISIAYTLRRVRQPKRNRPRASRGSGHQFKLFVRRPQPQQKISVVTHPLFTRSAANTNRQHHVQGVSAEPHVGRALLESTLHPYGRNRCLPESRRTLKERHALLSSAWPVDTPLPSSDTVNLQSHHHIINLLNAAWMQLIHVLRVVG